MWQNRYKNIAKFITKFTKIWGQLLYKVQKNGTKSVENGRKSQHSPSVIVAKNAVVAHMAVRVHDYRVEHQHGSEPLPRLFAKLIEER